MFKVGVDMFSWYVRLNFTFNFVRMYLPNMYIHVIIIITNKVTFFTLKFSLFIRVHIPFDIQLNITKITIPWILFTSINSVFSFHVNFQILLRNGFKVTLCTSNIFLFLKKFLFRTISIICSSLFFYSYIDNLN